MEPRLIRGALEAVRTACVLAGRVQDALVPIDAVIKADRSPVTVADYGVQALVAHALAAACPELPIVGEEEGGELRGQPGLLARVVSEVQALRPDLDQAALLAAIERCGHPGGATGRFWTLDPIDGTKGFLRREQYALALALIEDGRVVLGVLGCPNLPAVISDLEGTRGSTPESPGHGGARANHDGAAEQRRCRAAEAPAGSHLVSLPSAGGVRAGLPVAGWLYYASEGQGAWGLPLAEPGAQPLRLRVHDSRDRSRLRLCESVEAEHSDQAAAAALARRLGLDGAPLRMDSQCKYALVARGDACLYLRLPARPGYVEKIWDHAAGSLLVTEAGGAVSDAAGRPLDFARGRTLAGNRGVVATSGALHAAALAALAAPG